MDEPVVKVSLTEEEMSLILNSLSDYPDGDKGADELYDRLLSEWERQLP